MSWLIRKRVPSETVSGANVRIQYGGLFGVGEPRSGMLQVNPNPGVGIYSYHEGDVFLPGTGNWVFEPNFELPLVTIWGSAFIRNPNTFKPLQPPQVWSHPNVQNNGMGGLQAGQFDGEGLINPEGEAAPFSGDFAVPLGYQNH